MRLRKHSVAVSVLIALIFALIVSSPSSRVNAAPEYALQFDGVDDRVTFGMAPELGAQTFTLELWFKKTGAGLGTTTGGGGIPLAVPLLTKGRAQAEGGSLDMNYFLGIDAARKVLVADFEDAATGLNHPVQGRTAICDDIWYHAAATYDGTTWRLYLNGELESTLPVGAFTPQSLSAQHAALGTAMDTGGVAAGFFKGRMHEARVWNVARSQADILGTMRTALFASQPGLIGRWGLDVGSGTTVTNIAGLPNGTLAPAAAPPAWTVGSSDFATTLVPGADVLQLTGTAAAGDFVRFGPATSTLGAATFTIETWFKRDAAGIATSTGTGGVVAIPLVTKGMAEAEGGSLDMNYFLGIRPADNLLVADFEDTATGANHPVAGVTPIAANSVWHHAAATYDGTTWRLYLDGVLDRQLVVGSFTPQFNSIQHAALGSALNSTGGVGTQTQGFFAGSLDEARIWNYARTAPQIAASATREIPNATGLLARWSFNDCCGRVIDSTGHVGFGPPPVVGGAIQGATLQGTGWKWAARGDTTLSTTVNLAPTVNAGADATVTLPASGMVTGSVTDDAVNTGSPLLSAWSKTSGPGTVIFGDSLSASTSVSFTATGTYVLKLSATDGELSGEDSVTILVDGLVNQAPVVEAGADQTITLPTDIVALTGVVTDDGPSSAVTTMWSKLSGPGTVTFANAAAASTSATFSAEGTYVLQLTAHDGLLPGGDTLSVVVNPDPANSALRLGGTNAYVTFGGAPQLGASAFTLEAWIRRDGTGIGTFTGTGGVTAVPLVTKGMAEAEGGSVDMNYFLGIIPGSGQLAADFEDTATGLNHPITGSTAIPADGGWHHVAASYDGTTWRLYLDGNQDAMLVVGAFTPRADSIQHAAIGTALNSLGVVTAGQPAGRFHGVIDEVRIWNYARSGAQIGSGTNREIPSASGLLARWGLSEAAGTMVTDSTDAAVTGTIVGTNYSWVSGAHITGERNAAPVVDAGADHTVTLPAVGMLLGSATDDGLTGAPVTSEWSQVSGPGVAMFGTPAAAITTVDFTALGTYVLQLTASDGELSATPDVVTITVDGVVNQAPIVEVGADQTITLPNNVAAVSGTANDDGLPGGSLTTVWSKVSGPGSVAFADAAASATTATFSMHGTYVLRLTATDGVLGGNDTLTITVNSDPANQALQFGGTNAYVALGPAPGLGAERFTIETWFRRDGTGIATNTGSGGIPAAIPLITKGMAEVDAINNRDMNYFLGIRLSDGVLVADFEDTATAGNHPVVGITPIVAGPAWHHAAATYDGNNWRLYLDGQLEKELLNVGATPRADSIQHAALGTALNSAGSSGAQPQGFFHGVLDESRIWNYARSAEQISRGRRLEIATSTPGLLGRWGMNEGTGTSAANSAGPGLPGDITGSAWSWTEGAPFTAANQAPAAADDAATTNEDAAATVAVLGNDTDADGDALAITQVGLAAHGTVVANADGTLTYTPAGDFSGPDSFTYVISDGQGGSATATVSVTVAAVNDPPVAADDVAATSEDTPVVIAVLGNDVDGDSGSLTPMVVAGPAQGSLTIAADGSIAYAPAADFNGTDSFTYKANDGAADSGVATVTITVEGVNDAPAVASDSYSVDEDGMLNTPDSVLGNDSDAEGDSLSAVLVNGPAHGQLTLNANGSFIYTPNADFNGNDSFTYLANDDAVDSAAATVALTINPVNDAPVASDDTATTAEDTAATIAVLANDSDIDGDILSVTIISLPAHGTAAINPDGTITYTPAANYNGSDSFSYKNSDGSDASSDAVTVTITVTAVDDAPVANDDALTTSEDTGLNVSAPGMLANDSDADGNSLSAVLVADPSHGTLTVNSDGSFSYTPAADFHGTDTFSYKANDGSVDSGPATVTITVTPVNDAPAATEDHFSATEDTALSAAAPGVFANDTDVEGSSLTAVLVSSTSHGTLTLNADGSFDYTPDGNYNGADSFTYTVSDGSASSDAVTVTIAVNAVNDVPVASADSFSTSEDVALVVAAPGVFVNDTDADGDSLTAVLASGPSHGTLALNSDGTFSYTPTADYNGPDSFTYHVNDGTVDSSIVTVAIDVTAVPDAPVAAGDGYSRREDTTFDVAAPGVLGNDRDGDGDPLTATLTSGTSHGTLALNSNGSFTYTPEANFNGTDSFTYQAHDGTMAPSTATVTLTVRAINDAPVALGEAYSTNEDTPLTIVSPGVLANDTDLDSATLTVVRVSGPGHGTLTLGADGGFTYKPAANYNGPDTFVYRTRDGDGGSDLATVTVMVVAVEDAPVAKNQARTLNEDGLRTVTLTATDADADPDQDSNAAGIPLTFTIVTHPAHGVLTGTLPTLSYDPDPNYNGPDSFSFKANDGGMDSNIATVSLTITPVNDAPVAQAADYTTAVNTPLSRRLVATDVEGDPLTYAVTLLPTKGTVTVNPATGAFTYVPFAGKTGIDSFKFKANDGRLSSNGARIEIQIQ